MRYAQGEAAGKLLADWLNGEGLYRRRHKRTPAHQRIESLIDQLHSLMRGGWRIWEQMDSALFAEVQRKLSRYRMSPQIDPGKAGSLGMRFVWNPGASDEAKAVRLIVWLGERALLWKVRRCLKCKRWFYSRRQDNRFHSLACRLGWHQSTPAVKAKRAAAARERRADDKREERRFVEHLGRQQPKRRKRGSR